MIFSINCPDNIVFVTPKVKVEIINVTFDNVELVNDFRDKSHASNFRKLIEEGQYGIYAKLNGKVIGHAWAKVCKRGHCLVNGYMIIGKN